MLTIRNEREKIRVIVVITLVSVVGSLLVTALATNGELQMSALIPAVTVPMVVAPLATLFSANKILEIHRLNERLQHMLEHDQMTQLLNRGTFFARIDESNSAKSTLMMFDIDHFKAINDTYGHAAGDEAIRKVANLLRDGIGQDGLAARVGGEEFAIFGRDMSVEQAQERAEAIRAAVEAQNISHGDEKLSCTISVGLVPYTSGQSIDQAMSLADQALYRSKAQGRNRITIITEA